MPPSARHSKVEKRWGTPSYIVEAARKCMGNITLDPCSEERFNAIVEADKYYSLLERGEDALTLPWTGNVLCNPPGGAVRKFWKYAFTQPIDQMIWVGFSVEQLCVLADLAYHPLDFSCCILRKRIPFTRHDGYRGSPSHGNYICGIYTDADVFEYAFADYGKIIHGKGSERGSHRFKRYSDNGKT